jgi:hypothetical protein
MKKIFSSGSIPYAQLIGWGITIAITSISFTNSQITKVSEAQTQIVQRVSVVETKGDQYTKDIESINRKLDSILKELK